MSEERYVHFNELKPICDDRTGATNITSQEWLDSPTRQRAINILEGKELSTEVLSFQLKPYDFHFKLFKYSFQLLISKSGVSFVISKITPTTNYL